VREKLNIGDLVRYYSTDPHGDIVMGSGVGVITEVFYNDRNYDTMYRVLTQDTGLQLWYSEQEVALIQKVS
tara:strand:+ start:377 stop:589 length:213 start_codon:yes stop_codon:yes gene_type:complete